LKKLSFTWSFKAPALQTLFAACGISLPQGAIATVGKTAVTKAQFDTIVRQSKAQAASDAKVIYAAGYDPAKPAATTSMSPSPSSSASPAAAASSTASPSASQTP
jgi:hypothetical protein